IVKSGSKSMREGISQLSSLMDRAGGFGGDMTGNPSRKRELFEQPLHSLRILSDMRIDFAVGPFQIGVGDQSRSAMSRTGEIEGVQVIFDDDSIEMHIDKVQPRSGSPVAKQTGFDMLSLERFTQQRICQQVDLPHRKIVGSAPVGVHPLQFQ